MKLWEHRKQLLEITNIEDYCFILVKNASLNYIEKEERRPTLSDHGMRPSIRSQYD